MGLFLFEIVLNERYYFRNCAIMNRVIFYYNEPCYIQNCATMYRVISETLL